MWEWVLQEDAKLDLSDPTTAAGWFADVPNRAVPFKVKWDKDRKPWSRPIVVKWQEALYSLRSVAKRLQDAKVRPTDIDPIEADRVFERYLSRLMPVIKRSDGMFRRLVEPAPLRAATFKGIEFNPGVMTVSDYPKLDKYWAAVAMIMDGTWRKAFGSLATDQIMPVCSGCGKQLELTAGGKIPRADRCKKCRFKEWYTAQPQSKLRNRWRANKAAERAREQGDKS